MKRLIALIIAAIQLAFAVRLFIRLRQTLGGQRIPISDQPSAPGSVSVIVPVLNEVHRIGHCIESLILQGDDVSEILIVDGGSTDGTPEFLRFYEHRDARVRVVNTGPVPTDWNGKAWGLQTGLEASADTSRWIITIDADVEVAPGGIASAVSFAESQELPFLSVATSQNASSPGLSLIHPSLLSTLVYRFGIPGHVARALDEVQANGQFGLYRRKSLLRAGGFRIARDSICEDVTLARHLFLSGYQVGFFEGDRIAETSMYADGMECLRNWPRSLSLRDQFDPNAGLRGLASMFFLQVLPVISLFWMPREFRASSLFVIVNRVLAGTRFGVAFGMRRAYSEAHWLYWLSPLFDPIAIIVYLNSLLKRRHVWRGRLLVGKEF